MSNEYHSNLVEAVGSSFYYYTNHKNFNLLTQGDFEKLTKGWRDEYSGNWEIYNASSAIVYNIFKPCVDQLVYRVMDATEKEIDRRVGEIVNEYLTKLENKDK